MLCNSVRAVFVGVLFTVLRKEKTICWNIIVGNCQKNHEHVWKQTHGGKREYPVAMIRRLVNGFVHDLHPPQLHMFLSETDHLLSVSPAVFVASPVAFPAQETEDHVSPAEREHAQKLIHRLHVAGGHVSKTSLRLLLQRRGCPV